MLLYCYVIYYYYYGLYEIQACYRMSKHAIYIAFTFMAKYGINEWSKSDQYSLCLGNVYDS